MKKGLAIILPAILSLASCGFFRSTITINDALAEKVKIDASKNPAQQYVIKEDLSDKNIKLNDVLVKQVTPSTNIDYDFCIITDVTTEKGLVECYIYTRNVNRVSKLEVGKTRIDVIGEFGRFFTLLDEYYTKIEIVEAKIIIK